MLTEAMPFPRLHPLKSGEVSWAKVTTARRTTRKTRSPRRKRKPIPRPARSKSDALRLYLECDICYTRHSLASRQMQSSTAKSNVLAGLEQHLDALRETGAYFWNKGWSLGTSSNYSVVLSQEPLELLITASGKDKGKLSRTDFDRVGRDGKPTSLGQPKSSAETLLHIVAAEQQGVGAVLHTHSVW